MWDRIEALWWAFVLTLLAPAYLTSYPVDLVFHDRAYANKAINGWFELLRASWWYAFRAVED